MNRARAAWFALAVLGFGPVAANARGLFDEAEALWATATLLAYGLARGEPSVQVLARIQQERQFDAPSETLEAWFARWEEQSVSKSDRAFLARLACQGPVLPDATEAVSWAALCRQQEDHWIDTEPGNALPWVLRAVQAEGNGDTDGLAEAERRIAASEYFDSGAKERWRWTQAWVNAVLGGRWEERDRVLLTDSIAGPYLSPGSAIASLCPSGQKSAPEHLQALCRRLGLWMTTSRDSGLLVSVQGYAIVEKYARDPAEAAEMALARENLRALYRAKLDMLDARGADQEDIEPAWARPQSEFTAMVIQRGERQALIDWIEASPAQTQP